MMNYIASVVIDWVNTLFGNMIMFTLLLSVSFIITGVSRLNKLRKRNVIGGKDGWFVREFKNKDCKKG